jgi:hypothetical protein
MHTKKTQKYASQVLSGANARPVHSNRHRHARGAPLGGKCSTAMLWLSDRVKQAQFGRVGLGGGQAVKTHEVLLSENEQVLKCVTLFQLDLSLTFCH